MTKVTYVNKVVSSRTGVTSGKKRMPSDISMMFAQPSLADEFIRRTTFQFGEWVKEHSKSYWDVVRFYGFRKGVLRHLSRKHFAHLLVTICPEALEKSDTESSLKYIMDKFPHSDGFHKRTKNERKQQRPDVKWQIDLLPETHICNTLLNDLETLWGQKLPHSTDSSVSIMEERIGDYLKACSENSLYNKVCFHPVYYNCTVSISVEQYVSQKFMDQNEPSHIIVYICHDGTVTEKVVNEYAGQYYQYPIFKVYICSTHSFDHKTQDLARSKNIGLVLVNPMYRVTEKNYVVPRTIGMYDMEQMKLEILCGKRSMTTPFVLYDEQGATFSLVDTLTNHGIKVNKDICNKAPFYSNKYIENKALELIKKDVEEFCYKMKSYPLTHEVPSFEVDIKQLLMNEGYQLEEADMSGTGQLAYIDMQRKKVVTDAALANNICSLRYSHGHELGHAVLHSNINVFAFGESDTTLNATAFILSDEQKWLEHHANHYAACLLMPSEVVGYLYSFYYQAQMGCNTVQPFYYEDTPYKRRDYFGIVRPMAQKMKVSVEALKWRLIKLGLVKYHQRFQQLFPICGF